MQAEQLEHSGRDRGLRATDLVREAERIRVVPGIRFKDRGAGRTACLAGAGVPVWLVIKLFRNAGEDRFSLSQALHWMTHDEIQAAFDYYEHFPAEVEAELADEASITPERVLEMNRAMRVKLEAST
jgi:uncharacterized protein (DUF433 family)